MRFRANVEDVGSFFSKSPKKTFMSVIDDALDLRRNHTGHREAAKAMYNQVHRISYAHYM